MTYFYRNAQSYEVWFVHEGEGVLRSQFGRLEFMPGDYIIIPFGVTWMMELTTPEARFFTIEAPSQIEPPKRYRNKYGLGWVSLPLDFQHSRFHAHHWQNSPAAACSPDL